MRVRNFWAGLDANAARGLPGAEYKCQCRRQASPPPTAEHVSSVFSHDHAQKRKINLLESNTSSLSPGWTLAVSAPPLSEGWGASWKDGRTRSSEAECKHEDGVPAPGAAGQGIACHVQRVATCSGVPRPRRFLCKTAFHARDAFCAVHVRAHAWQPVACRLSVTPAGRRNGRTA